MPVAHTRRPADLSQTDFRTALRGFDRDQVRAVLARVAADCRFLQTQNASLKRQLANLEGALRACQQRTEGASVETPVQAQPAARERDANGIRIVAHTFQNTLKNIDVALVAVPALSTD